jgi:hypothetical protein
MSPILVASSEPTELRKPVPVSNASDVPDTKDIAGSNSSQHLLPGKTLLSILLSLPTNLLHVLQNKSLYAT